MTLTLSPFVVGWLLGGLIIFLAAVAAIAAFLLRDALGTKEEGN